MVEVAGLGNIIILPPSQASSWQAPHGHEQPSSSAQKAVYYIFRYQNADCNTSLTWTMDCVLHFHAVVWDGFHTNNRTFYHLSMDHGACHMFICLGYVHAVMLCSLTFSFGFVQQVLLHLKCSCITIMTHDKDKDKDHWVIMFSCILARTFHWTWHSAFNHEWSMVEVQSLSPCTVIVTFFFSINTKNHNMTYGSYEVSGKPQCLQKNHDNMNRATMCFQQRSCFWVVMHLHVV